MPKNNTMKVIHNSDILLKSMMNTDMQGNSILHPKNNNCNEQKNCLCEKYCSFSTIKLSALILLFGTLIFYYIF